MVKICLRRLGLAHTGIEGEAEVEVEGSAQLRKLVGQVAGHKRVAAVMEDLQERCEADRPAGRWAGVQKRLGLCRFVFSIC